MAAVGIFQIGLVLLSIVVPGLILVVLGQIMRATVDTADYHRQMLEMTARHYDAVEARHRADQRTE